MDDQLLSQLNRRIEEHHQGLCHRLEDLNEAIQSFYSALLARLDAHEAYHQHNEHRWGLIRLAGRHPFRLAMLAFTGAWLLSGAAPGSVRWLEALSHRLLQIIFN